MLAYYSILCSKEVLLSPILDGVFSVYLQCILGEGEEANLPPYLAPKPEVVESSNFACG